MQTLYPPGAALEDDLDAAYAYPGEPGDRWVRANMVSSLDGAASADGRTELLSNPVDQDLLGRLRALSDVVLVGAGTIRAEGYGPLRPRRARREARVARGQAPTPTLAVVSGSLGLDPAHTMFTEAPARTLVVTHAQADVDRRKALAEVADVVVAGDTDVDLAAALDQLADRGLTRVLTEGGPTLLGGLAAIGRLDELCLSVSPGLTSGTASRIVTGPDLDAGRLRLGHVLEDDGFLFLRHTR